jgi:putative ABC transport system permease protein
MPRLARVLRNLFRSDRVDRELDDELRAYVEMTVDEKRSAGLSDTEARRLALAELGGIEPVKERVRDVRAGVLLDQVRQDLAYAIRTLRKNAAFTTIAVATLAIGIGATTAVFSIVDTVVFRSLPYADPERLVRVCELVIRANACLDRVSLEEYEQVRRLDLFEQVAADDGIGVTVVHPDGSRASIGVGLVTPNWLSTLGVRPLLGRDFHSGDGLPGGDGVLLLTQSYWKRQYGSSPDAIGAKVTFDGVVHTVVGVLPPNVLRHGADVMKPLVLRGYTDRSLDLVARLRPGASLPQAEVAIAAVQSLTRRDAGVNGDRGQLSLAYGASRLAARHLGRSYAEVTRQAVDGLTLMLWAVALVLLVACANVVNLLLTRAGARRRESVVRAALGASRGRLLRQSLVENLLLFAIGGIGGVLLAQLLVGSLTAFAISGGYMPERMVVALDARILAAAIAMSIVTGLVFGLIPAMQASRVDVNAGLRASAPTATTDRGRARRLLIAAEVALSLVLLAGFGLLTRSFVRVYANGAEFDPAEIIVTASDGGRSFREAMLFWRAALDRVRMLHGVSSAALTSRPPANDVRSKGVVIEGHAPVAEGDAPLADDVLVSDGYFETMRIPLVRGRTFTPADDDSSAPVVIISESVARRHFGGADPIGRSIRLLEKLPMTCCATPGPVEGVWRRIVGVVRDIRQANLDDGPSATIYRPYGQIVEHDMFLVLRASSSADAGRLTRDLRTQLLAVDPAHDWMTPRPMWQMIRDSESIRLRRFVLTLLGTFAALALILAAVGIFGVASSVVAERTREIGLRMALGATRTAVFRQIVGEMAALAVAGTAAGLIAAAALTRAIRAMLFGVSPADAATYVAVAMVLGVVVLIASWIPARKATRIDPLVALRLE